MLICWCIRFSSFRMKLKYKIIGVWFCLIVFLVFFCTCGRRLFGSVCSRTDLTLLDSFLRLPLVIGHEDQFFFFCCIGKALSEFHPFPNFRKSPILQTSASILTNDAFFTRILQVCTKIANFSNLLNVEHLLQESDNI